LEPSRGHHLEGLPSVRYAVSKTAGSRDLGGSTPSPSASGGMAELVRQRVASAQAAHVVRRFESCCLRHRPVAQRLEQWASNPRAPVRSGPGRPFMRRRSTVGRPVVTRRMLVRPQPSQPRTNMPRSSNGRGRRSLTPEARVRVPLGVLLHSTPSDASGTCGPVVCRVRRVRFPSRASLSLAVAQW
jgi:hypothetical protein